MPLSEISSLKQFTFSKFPADHVTHGIFTRQGGVSPNQWTSLNLGGLNGDNRENVIENRRRIFEAVGRPVESLYDTWQVHGVDVVCTKSPRRLDAGHIRADAILTDRPEITLFMRFADCVPLFFYDTVLGVVGIAHAGWMGTVAKIGAETVRIMHQHYGSKPGNIIAGIGPSIGPDHYEVGEDVGAQVRKAFGGESPSVLIQKGNRIWFDLWKANQIVLEQAGVEVIEVAEICTACHTEDWFSHRAEKGKTGRFGALIGLKS